MKKLDGRELVGFIKERQAHEVAGMKRQPKLVIIRDSDNPVILKYVNLKEKYGEDVGVLVDSVVAGSVAEIKAEILAANKDPEVDGVILQLPIQEKEAVEELTELIDSEKDVDGLSSNGKYDSATATAINWLLAGYDIKLAEKKIAIVGRGKLVGAPLYKMFTDSSYRVSLFHRGSDMSELRDHGVIITATGVPGLITNEMVGPGAVIVDAGTASENGVLVGDVAEEVRERDDLKAITPKIGGVGPMTVACLFDHVIQAAKKRQ